MDENNFPNIFEEPTFEPQNNLPSPKRFERSRSDVIVAGLCSGIAKYLNTDPSLIRLIAILSLLLGVWSIAAYLVAAFLIPPERSPIVLTEDEKLKQKKINFRTVVSGLMMLTGLYLGFIYVGIFSIDRLFIFPNSFMFPFIAIVFGVYYLTINKEKIQETPDSFPDRFSRSRQDRYLLGVCAGLARYLNVETTTVRIVFSFAALFTLGFFALIYFVFSLITKMEEPTVEIKE